MQYKEIIDNLKVKGGQCLDLSEKNIEDDDAKSLAEALKGIQISELNLSNNKIGCNGMKHLSNALRDIHQLTKLILTNNSIGDEGVKCLSKALITSQITYLDLQRNNIGINGAECLNKLLDNTKIKIIYCDISYAISDNVKYISWNFNLYADVRWDSITLFDNAIGMKCAQYINNTFQTTGIKKLDIFWLINKEDVQYLAKAFKNIKIGSLTLDENHIMSYNFPYLVEVFKDSKIFEINISSRRIGPVGAKYLAEFLKEVKVLKINLYLNFIGDEGMKYLAPALKNSEVMYLDLSSNNIQSEGARFLSEVLSNSKILDLNLSNNNIGIYGAKYLADRLQHSQVTYIHLHGNSIGNTGYHYLIDVVDNTNISWANLHRNDIDEKLEGETFFVYSIPRKTTSIAFKVRYIFKKIVSLNPISKEYEFIVPSTQKAIYPKIQLDDYAFLIRTLYDHPNSKVHILHKVCCEDYYFDCYDFDTMDKINEFIKVMPNKFNTFFENKLLDLIELFGAIGNIYVNLVKQFEEMNLCNVVQNLLLHRILYYVDENQEILHPYIYKMLHKYRMPLFSQQLEPDKIGKIISYYQDHQEIDGTEEIINLLESAHF